MDRQRRPDLTDHRSILIEDRYIIGTRLRLRRMTDSVTGEAALKLTKKYEAADALARPIVTSYLDDAEYALLLQLPAMPLIKRRYPIHVPEGEIGIDIFEGALSGLQTAEIEIADDAALRAFAPPEWTIADISNDPRFQGGNLIRLDALGMARLIAEFG